MKTTILILAVVMMLKPIFPVIEYVVNYDYIATVLCVNKAKPEMHCNGKCHLMKEMAKESESEKPISSDKKTTVQENEVLFFQVIKTFKIKQGCLKDKTAILDNYSNLYFHLLNRTVFHPPTIA